MTEVRLDVYAHDNTSFVRTLTQAHTRTFTDSRHGPGSAAFAVDHAATDDWDALDHNRIVRWLVKDPGEDWAERFGSIVRDMPPTLTVGSSSQPEGWSRLVRCDGVLSVLGYQRGGAVLYPKDGLDGRMTNPREFSWRDNSAPVGDWVEPVSQGRWAFPTMPELVGRAPGWPDPEFGEWIGDAEGPNNILRVLDVPNASGDKTGRVDMYAVAAGTWRMTFDGGRSRWFDPFEVARLRRTLANRKHTVALESQDGPVLWAAIRDDSVLYRTFTEEVWGGPGDPESPWLTGPQRGLTRGSIMNIAIDEAQHASRGELPWVTVDFTDTHDSNNTEWDREIIHAFRMEKLGQLDDDILGLMPGDTHMTPAGLLRLFDRRGVDRTGTITLDLPFGASLSGEGPRATRYLYETEGGFGEGFASAAEALYGVMADVAQFGTGIDPAALVGAVEHLLGRESRPWDDWTVDPPDTVTAYRDADLGDRVLGRRPDGTTTPVRIDEFTLTDAPTGRPEWVWKLSPDD